MTVTTMKKSSDARRPASSTPRLTCTWVPVRGADGRTRMEMRWVDASRRSARSAA